MTVMHVLRSRELAIEVACRFFDLGRHDALEVGPMLGPREENVLDHSASSRSTRLGRPQKRGHT